MNKKMLIIVLFTAVLVMLFMGCGNPGNAKPPEQSPSASPSGLQEVTGTVKEVKPGLILLALADNAGDYMLRISENTKWDTGVSTEIKSGNVMACLVKPEPTYTTPSQGEVYRVLKNDTP